MNEVKIFSNSLFGEVRVINNGDEPMFCLADVCRALDIKNASQCKTRLKANGIIKVNVDGVITNEGVSINTLGNNSANFINEPNLYKCICF